MDFRYILSLCYCLAWTRKLVIRTLTSTKIVKFFFTYHYITLVNILKKITIVNIVHINRKYIWITKKSTKVTPK